MRNWPVGKKGLLISYETLNRIGHFSAYSNQYQMTRALYVIRINLSLFSSGWLAEHNEKGIEFH